MPGQYYRDPVSGKRVFMRDGKVFLKDGSGNLTTVSAQVAGDKILSGARTPATAEDVAQRDLEKKAGGAGRAFVEGAATGFFDVAGAIPRVAAGVGGMISDATLGTDIGADPLGDALSGRKVLENAAAVFGDIFGEDPEEGQSTLSGEGIAKEYAEEARATAAVNPFASGAGRALGETIGSGGLMKGGGAAANALRQSGRSLALARGAAGVVEGVGLGYTQAGENAYLEDTELSAQEAIAGMGFGGVLGGLVGLGAGRLESAMTKRAETSVARKALGTVDDKSAARLADTDIADTAEKVLGEKPSKDLIGTVKRHIKDGLDKADVYIRRDEILGAATRETVENLGELQRSARPIMNQSAMPNLKRSNVKITTDKSAALAASQERSLAMRELADALKDRKDLGNNALRKRVSLFLSQKSDDIVNAKTAEDAFIAFDKTKRGLQNWKIKLEQSARQSGDALKMEQAQALAKELEVAQKPLREFLMNEQVWGKAGADQRAVNGAWQKWMESNKVFNQKFLYRTGNVDYHTGIREYVVDDGKVSSFVNGIGRPGNRISEDYLKAHIDATEGLAKAINESYDLGKDVGRISSSVQKLKSSLSKADQTVRTVNQIDELLKSDVGGGSFLGSPLGAGALGGAFGGPLGAAAGAAYGLATRPGTMMRHAIAVQQLRRNLNQRIGSGLDDFFQRFAGTDVVSASKAAISKAGAALKKTRDTAAKTAKTMGAAGREVAVPASMVAFLGSYPDKKKAYEQRAKEIRVATANYGEEIRRRVPQNLGRLPETMPQFTGNFVNTVTRGAEFLKSKLPAGVHGSGFVPAYRKSLPPSDLEIMKFARYWSAVNDPVSVIEDLGKGIATHEQIEALGAVYPDLLVQVKNQVRDRLVKLDMDGTPISHQGRLQLDLLLGLGGAGEPTFAPDFLHRMEGYRQKQAEAQAQKQQGSQREAPQVAGRLESGTDAITQLRRRMAS